MSNIQQELLKRNDFGYKCVSVPLPGQQEEENGEEDEEHGPVHLKHIPHNSI